MNQQLVEIGTLEVGTVFIADWRPEGKRIGKLVDKGTGSVGVKVPDLYEDGKLEGQGYCRWSHGTLVIPTTPDQFNLQSGSGNRNRSAADNPVERVHAICNEMRGKPRDEIIAKCVAEGINKNTAKTQYYAWRKRG